MSDSPEAALRRELASAGLDVCGSLHRQRWDALTPGAFQADWVASEHAYDERVEAHQMAASWARLSGGEGA